MEIEFGVKLAGDGGARPGILAASAHGSARTRGGHLDDGIAIGSTARVACPEAVSACRQGQGRMVRGTFASTP